LSIPTTTRLFRPPQWLRLLISLYSLTVKFLFCRRSQLVINREKERIILTKFEKTKVFWFHRIPRWLRKRWLSGLGKQGLSSFVVDAPPSKSLYVRRGETLVVGIHHQGQEGVVGFLSRVIRMHWYHRLVLVSTYKYIRHTSSSVIADNRFKNVRFEPIISTPAILIDLILLLMSSAFRFLKWLSVPTLNELFHHDTSFASKQVPYTSGFGQIQKLADCTGNSVAFQGITVPEEATVTNRSLSSW